MWSIDYDQGTGKLGELAKPVQLAGSSQIGLGSQSKNYQQVARGHRNYCPLAEGDQTWFVCGWVKSEKFRWKN